MNKFGLSPKIHKSGFKILALLLLAFWPSLSRAVTYTATPAAEIPNNDAVGMTSTLTVPDSLTIADMDITLKITHAWVADLVVTLTHVESGHSLILLDRVGINDESGDTAYGCGLDNIDVTFDDEIALPDASDCTTAAHFAYGIDGTSRYDTEAFSDTTHYVRACSAAEYQCDTTSDLPALNGHLLVSDGSVSIGLDTFYGEDMTGTWQLKIVDGTIEDTGTLDEWSLTFLNTNCGNGTIEADGGEECDDGNHESDDGCSVTCTITYDNDVDTYFDDVDCDDGNNQVHPDAEEICDDGVDNDCDGSPLISREHFVDGDNDGYGDENATAVSSCDEIAGTVLNNEDCDDSDASISPDGIEITTDGHDNDCDGQIDESVADEDSTPGDDDDTPPADDTPTGDDTTGDDTTGDDTTGDDTTGDDTPSPEAEDPDKLVDDAADEGADGNDAGEWSKHPLKSDVVAGCSLQSQASAAPAWGVSLLFALFILGSFRLTTLASRRKKIF